MHTGHYPRFPMLTRFFRTDDEDGDIQLHYGKSPNCI